MPQEFLTAASLLAQWERGRSQSPVLRTLSLLQTVSPDTSLDQLSQMPLGTRDAHLLSLREQVFGTTLASVATCPQCDERLQLTLNVEELFVPARDAPATFSLTHAPYTIAYRLPNSADLLALAECDNVQAGRNLLLQRCVQEIRHEGETESIETLPAQILDLISVEMARADPQADLQFDLKCPVCAQQWLAAFDIGAFLWSEVDAWARRVLREVHVIATAYGWSEREILNLSAVRRQMYLDLIANE